MELNKLAIIQARMSSSRLPGKVLMDIDGKPMLQHVIERTRQSGVASQVLLATTTDPSDDILEQFCREQGIGCYRGSLHDVLDRFYKAAFQWHADVIIRLTADCPLLDPRVLDLTVSAFLGSKPSAYASPGPEITQAAAPIMGPCDFAADRLPPPWQRTLPIGLDVEVCSFAALEQAWKQADQPFQREHVMPYLYEGVAFPPTEQPALGEWYVQQGRTLRGFNVALLNHHPDYGALRWTVDTPADLQFVRQVFTHFSGQDAFGWQDILDLIKRKPELADLNAEVKHKTAYDIDTRMTPLK